MSRNNKLRPTITHFTPNICRANLADSRVANRLYKTTQTVRLKGVRRIVTGISATVAEMLVDLGIDCNHIETTGTFGPIILRRYFIIRGKQIYGGGGLKLF